MPIKRCVRTRYKSGAVLAFALALCVILVVIGGFFFGALRIFSGSHELNRASDAGILNATKQALVQPALALNDNTLPNAASLPYSDFTGFSDQLVNGSASIDLQTYNRCVAQAVIVSANALAINNETALADAVLVCQAVQGLGQTLQYRFVNQPLDTTFSQLANANTLDMLGSNSTVTLQTGLSPAYVSNDKSAANVWLDPSILPGYISNNPASVLNQANFQVPLDQGAASAPDKSGDPSAPSISTWITGYAPITLTLGAAAITLYTVPLQPTATTHLIDFTRFNNSLKPPDGNTPPNSFSSKDSGNVNLQVQANVQAISCAIIGCNNIYNPASIPSGYIRINNLASATALGAPAVANQRYNAANSYFDYEGASKEAITAGCYWISPVGVEDTSILGTYGPPPWQTQFNYFRIACNNLVLMQEWYDFARTGQPYPSIFWNDQAAGAAWLAANGLELVNGSCYQTSLDPLTLYGTTCQALQAQIGINGAIPSQYLNGASILAWCCTSNANYDPTNPTTHVMYNCSTSISIGNMMLFSGALESQGSVNNPPTTFYLPPSPTGSYNTTYDYKQNSVLLSAGPASQLQRYLGFVSGQLTINSPDIQALVANITNGGPIITNMIPVVDHYYDGTAPNWMVEVAQDTATCLGYSISTSTNSGDLANYSIVRWLKEQVLSLMQGYIQGAVINMPYGASGVATSGMMNYQRCGVNPDGAAANPNAYLVHYAEYGAIANVVGNDQNTYTNVPASTTIETYGSPAQLLTQIFETLNGPLPLDNNGTVDNGVNSAYIGNTHTFDTSMADFQTLMNTLLQRVREIDPSFAMNDLYTALGWNNIGGGPSSGNFYDPAVPGLPLGGTLYLYKDPSTAKLVCKNTLPITDTGLAAEGVGTASGEIDISTGYYAVCGDTTFSSALNSMVNVDQDGSPTASHWGDAGVHRRPYLYQDSICQANDKLSYYPAVGMNNLLGQLTFSTNLRATATDGATVVNSITFNGEN